MLNEGSQIASKTIGAVFAMAVHALQPVSLPWLFTH
jgi:hypothetical protein